MTDSSNVSVRRADRPVYTDTLASQIHPVHAVIGKFRLDWTCDEHRRWSISVVHVHNPSRPVWMTEAGAPFLNFTLQAVKVTESRGFFEVDEHLQGDPFGSQVITGLEASEGTVTMTGYNWVASADHDVRIPWTFTVSAIDDVQIGLAVESDSDLFNRVTLTYAMDCAARIFGFGMQFTHLDMQGRTIPVLSQEPGIGRGIQPLTYILDKVAKAGGKWHTTNASVPHYITTHYQSLCLENTEYSVFDFSKSGRARVYVDSSTLRARAFYGETPLDLIAAYTRYAGRMSALPDWVHQGAIIGMQGGTEAVRQMDKKFRAHDTAISSYWLQDWVGARRTSIGWQLWWNWEVDESRYPGWDTLVKDLADQGKRVLTYINPFLVDPSEKGTFKRNLFQEAMENGYLVRTERGDPYMILNTSFSAAMVDLANPHARAWIKEIIKTQLLASGASGWMADFGEALPFDAALWGDTPASQFHNAYPAEWARVNREALEEMDRLGDAVFFTRSGFTQSPKFSTLFWMGDQLTSWSRKDGIKSTIVALLASGMSGYSLNHSDIGGYTATTAPRFPIKLPGISFSRGKELLLRWIELNAFTSVFRTHEGNQPARHWQVDGDDETLSHFARFSRVYRALAEYRKELCADAAQHGSPVVRHPWLHYPQDEVCQGLEMQFMLGEHVMVAPVLDAAMDVVRVYLPAGQWVHLWTGAKTVNHSTKGSYYRVPAPIGAPAVFYRADWPWGSRLRERLSQSGDLETGLRSEHIFSQA